MAIDVNGFGMGGASGGAPSKFYCERFDAGSAGVISNISSAANNTPSKSVMTRLLHLDGPGIVHAIAVYGNGVYKDPEGNNQDSYSDITAANSQARLIIEKDNEAIIRMGAYLVRRWGGAGYTYPLLMRSSATAGTNSQVPNDVFIKEPEVSSNRVIYRRYNFATSSTTDSAILYENVNNLVTDGVLNTLGITYPNGIYFEDSFDVYACFGNQPRSGNYTGGNGIWAIYELFD